MYFQQFYLGCLAHASYLIGSESEAVVVDPQRDVDQYLAEAAAHGLRIVYVLETHLHADFVSGHRELAERTGASIVFGARAGAEFPHRAVRQGDTLTVGSLQLHILETPGHTPEGICILVQAPGQPKKLLTGDTLFLGDVGRPDLAGSQGYTAQDMAGMLFDSLHNKILTLPDDVEVYPAHGAGSMCGRNISSEASSTIGQQRAHNYALQPMSRDAFVAMMTTDLPEAPSYFFDDAELNRTGAAALGARPQPPALSPAAFASAAQAGATVLDVRGPAEFGNGHLPGALNIGLGGQFASWAATLLAASPLGLHTPLLLVADEPDAIDEAVMRLARVGIESVQGSLAGGMYAWDQAAQPVATITLLPVEDLAERLLHDSTLQLLDVRRPAEVHAGDLPGSRNVELSKLSELAPTLDPERPTAVICQSGYRSAIAASMLARAGFPQLCNVVGGVNAWKQLKPVTSPA